VTEFEVTSLFVLMTNGLEIVRDRWDSLGSAGILLVLTQERPAVLDIQKRAGSRRDAGATESSRLADGVLRRISGLN